MMTALQRRNREHIRVLQPEEVPTGEYTPDREKAADEIRGWIEEGQWPLSAVEMEELGEYSAQHYRNTQKAWVEIIDEPQEEEEEVEEDTNDIDVSVPQGDVPIETLRDIADAMAKGLLDIEVPEDVEPASYYRGYLSCYIERVHENET